MDTRSGGGAAAAPVVCLFIECCREAECRAVEVVLDGGSWSWVALVGMEGLGGLGRPNAADRPDQRGARGKSGVCQGLIAELWRRKRATVYWRRLEQPEAGAERARSVSEASVERKRNVSGTRAEAEASFRPRSGRSDTRCRAAEGTARFGRPWTGKGCRHWSSPAEGRRMPPSLNALDSRSCAACGAA